MNKRCYWSFLFTMHVSIIIGDIMPINDFSLIESLSYLPTVINSKNLTITDTIPTSIANNKTLIRPTVLSSSFSRGSMSNCS